VAEGLAEKGIRTLDAPLLRTPTHAASGTLGFPVGGEKADLEEAREVLDAWGRSSLPTRRRIRAELEHLARWGWASHPSTRAEFGLDGPA
jgi:hypothetical protein